MPYRTLAQLLSITELPRAGLDLSSLVACAPWLSLTPRGDGHPVVVIPGFLASDDSTRILRDFLSCRGYNVYRWAQGRNLGAQRMGGYDTLVDYVSGIHQRTGRKVSLVGWSLGGVHALAVADRIESSVRSVITLGSPLNYHKRHTREDTNMVLASLRGAARQLNGEVLETPNQQIFSSADPLDRISNDLPITAIYSRADGVVPWRRSQVEVRDQRENIEVFGSHIGLGVNPAVFYAVADRLALAEGEFSAFHRRGWRALSFPDMSRPRAF